MSKRRTFSREYKLEAVKKVVEQGLSFAQVARDLQIRDTLIHSWKKTFQNDGTLQNEVTHSTSVEDGLKRLRIENRQLKIERDMLKKRRPSLQTKTTEVSIRLPTSEAMAHLDSMSSPKHHNRRLLQMEVRKAVRSSTNTDGHRQRN